MSPALILSIVAILIIGWIGLYKLTPNFRRNLTAEQAREVADRVKATEAKKRVCREWVELKRRIRAAAANGATKMMFLGGMTAENEKRLTDMGYTIINGWNISWTKRKD